MTHSLWDTPRADPFGELPREWGTRLRPLVTEFADEVLNGVLRRVEHGTGTTHVDVLAAEFRSLGEQEARHGRDPECSHTGMRTAATLGWRCLVITDPAPEEILGPLGEAIFAFQEEISTAAALGHSSVDGAGVDTLRRRRSRLLEALLGRTPQGEGSCSVPALVRAARWRMPEHVAVALLHREGPGETTPVPAPDVLVDLEREEPCALVPDPEGPGRPRALEHSLRGFHAVLGPTVPWTQAPSPWPEPVTWRSRSAVG